MSYVNRKIKNKEAWVKKRPMQKINVYRILFLALNTVGLGVTNFRRVDMARKYVVAFNVGVICVTMLCYGLVEIDGSLTPNSPYNLISTVMFWVLHYGKMLYYLLMSVRLVNNHKQLFTCYVNLQEVTKIFKKLNINVNYSYRILKIVFIVVYSTFPLVILLDVFLARRKLSVFTLWVFYLPSVAIILNLLLLCLLFTTCTHRFMAINLYLEQFTLSESSTTDRIVLTLRNLDPAVVNNKFSKNDGNLRMIFILHDKLCHVVKRVNELMGLEILFYMGLAALATLHFLYPFLIDLFRMRRQIKVHYRNSFAFDYWDLVYMQGILLVTYVSSQLMKYGNDTSSVLHTLRCIYPKLNDMVNTYSFQLMHEELNINAAGFFTVNFSSLYSFVGTLGTYLFILLQLDNGIKQYL